VTPADHTHQHVRIPMTLEELGRLEPGIWALILDAEAEVEARRRQRDFRWCPTECFYRKFKGRVIDLVGFERNVRPNDGSEVERRLRTPGAYDALYWHIYEVLHRPR
jgi:hypothetical protein